MLLLLLYSSIDREESPAINLTYTVCARQISAILCGWDYALHFHTKWNTLIALSAMGKLDPAPPGVLCRPGVFALLSTG